MTYNDIILYVHIYFHNLMNWVHCYYHYILALLPKRKVNLWIRAKFLQIYNHKPKRGAGYTWQSSSPGFQRWKSSSSFKGLCSMTYGLYLLEKWSNFPSWSMVCEVIFTCDQINFTGSQRWTFSHMKPKYWAKWCVFSGRTDSSELQVVTGMKLFVFNSESLAVCFFCMEGLKCFPFNISQPWAVQCAHSVLHHKKKNQREGHAFIMCFYCEMIQKAAEVLLSNIKVNVLSDLCFS